MAIYDAYGSQQFYYPNVLKYDPDQFEQRFTAELQSADGSTMVGYNLNQPSSQLTTVDRKLRNSIDLAADFVPGGVITGQPDLTTNLQAAIVAAHTLGIPEVTVVGDFYISDTVLLYPGVTLKGGGYDKTLIRASSGFPAGKTMIRSNRPSGWVPGCHNIGIEDIYLVGQTAKDIDAIDIGDSSYFKLKRIRMDLFNNDISFNRWIDDTRTESGGVITYPNAHDPTAGGQCYFGIIEQCYGGGSTRAVRFGGVVNRNTFISNTWSSNELAYDFSNVRGVYETNTFMTCNIEGCKSAFEWFFSINSPYHNVWINTSIDNGNPDFTCLAKDPGRQTFVGLSLFPYNDPTKVNWSTINPSGHRRNVIGTDNGEDIPNNQLKTQFREEIHSLAGIFNKLFVSKEISTTIAANATYTESILFNNLKQGAAISWTMQKLYPQLVIQVANTNNSYVELQMVNLTSAPVGVTSEIYISAISKSFQ